MKRLFKIGMKILSFMVLPLIAYILSYSLLMLVFIFVQKNISFLHDADMEIFRKTVILLSGANVALLVYAVVIRPILHIIRWIQNLSQEIYQIPKGMEYTVGGHNTGNSSVLNRSINFFYKDLFLHMEMLTHKLKQNEIEREIAEENRSEWIAGITHDLKTPLSYIQGYSSMIVAEQYHWSYEELKDFGSKIEEKSKHIKNLIDDLNITFQSDSGKLTLKRSRADIIEFLRNTVLDTANSPRSSEYQFSFVTERKSYDMNIDKVLFQRALQNILMNAILHNPPGTEIEVCVKSEIRGLQISISDNGKGMDEEEVNKLFERYYRGVPTDSPAEGSGLGLAIARQLIELHDGLIKAKSIKGQGTVIEISFPC